VAPPLARPEEALIPLIEGATEEELRVLHDLARTIMARPAKNEVAGIGFRG
jgi:hypothetical protein